MPDDTHFVNPYTFIPLPEQIKRTNGSTIPIPSHASTRDEAAELYSGSFTVTWKLRSPMALPASGSAGQMTSEWLTDDGHLRIPGSSIKGAVRSVHEALFAGCPRVLDSAFVPVYRDPVTPHLVRNWRMAVVSKVDNKGRAVQVYLTEADPVPIDGRSLRGLCGRKNPSLGLPQTGDFVAPGVRTPDPNPKVPREVAKNPTDVQRLHNLTPRAVELLAKRGYFVILVTDTAARNPKHPYYWTASPITTQTALVSDPAWEDFSRNVKEARDGHAGTPDWIDAKWPPPDSPAAVHTVPQAVARRRRANGELRVGDVIWVKVDEDRRNVIKIKMAQAWRDIGNPDDTLGKRAGVVPCRRAAELCLSCAIFGSIDETGQRAGEGQQDAYAGHVRFGTATSADSVAAPEKTLAPLGVPHPGAGIFYLENAALPTPTELDQPSRWGHGPDRGGTGSRRLRGRKFYWHADPTKQGANKDRHLKRRHHTAEATKTVLLVSPGPNATDPLSLTQRVTFDGLNLLAAQTLLAAFDPGRYLGRGDFGLHLGGGKPLGLGSVRGSIGNLDVTLTAERYDKDPADRSGEVEATIDDAALTARVGPVQSMKKAATRVLALDALGAWATRVSYPTTQSWTAFRTESFDKSYEFFTDYGGQAKPKKDGQGRTLRDPDGDIIYEREQWRPLPDVEGEQQIGSRP